MSSAPTRLDHAALRETLRQLFDLPAGGVVDADQALAPPATPYVSLRLETSNLLGNVRREFSAASEQESLLASCESIFRLTWHGPEAHQRLQDARCLLQSSATIDALRELKASLLRLTPVENLSAATGGQTLGQARFDLIIGHEHVLVVDLKRIALATLQAHGSSGLSAAVTVQSSET
ncbi:hypothetical protein RDJ20_23250 [Pseudomonas aeruginosa]|uniref:phage neck terminator protein n=1 Tax=Pseudomonas aeruginosa TaxID=287 RepID=UPI0018C52C59|nr:hypothetical protein [Pseudomonas aeruginosa]MBG5303691.1 hypothetical protein [Pseudomonas aeruginosa]MDI3651310.1 hypothetical protein [Pseudomonas aeruginosa]MDI3797970.1 hypothetical protein [Pseudomonas aeruginosa]WRH80670.1 hypothetical protein RDJ20_23250 [Pseudomonas aeruginosa]